MLMFSKHVTTIFLISAVLVIVTIMAAGICADFGLSGSAWALAILGLMNIGVAIVSATWMMFDFPEE